MKVIIAGSRTIHFTTLAIGQYVHRSGFNVSEVVSGGAQGVDESGERWARNGEIPVKVFPADWDRHGRAAGPIRNQTMADYADALILVWDGKSRGSRDMLNKAKARGLKIHEEIVP